MISSLQKRENMHACSYAERVREDFFDAGLIINELKCNLEQAFFLRQLGEGKFRVPVDRLEALQTKTDAIMSAKGGRIHARKL